jgi:hypothetical protein
MREHRPGGVFCRPSFDYLEERALLSGYRGIPSGPAGAFSSPGSGAPFHGSALAPAGAEANGAPGWQPSREFSFQPGAGLPGPGAEFGFPFQPNLQALLDFDFQASENAVSSPGSGSAAPDGSSSRPEPEVSSPSTGSLLASSAQNQTTSAFAAIVTTAGARASGPDATGGTAAVPLGAAGALPLQATTLYGAAASQGVSFVAQSEFATAFSGSLVPDVESASRVVQSPAPRRSSWNGAADHAAGFDTEALGELPRPSSADVIAALLPFDRAGIEQAIDRLIDQIDDLGARDVLRRGPARMILFSMALASGALVLEVVRRRWRNVSIAGEPRAGAFDPDRDRQSREYLLGFPELPGSWSSRTT